MKEDITPANKSQRIGYIDALRGFTMFLVVLEHVANFCWGVVGKGISVHEYLLQIRMPMFFFISGFVLYKEDVEWNARHIFRFFKKKIPVQLISPFIFFFIFLHLQGIPLSNGLLDKYKGGYWFTLSLLEFFVFYALVRFCVRQWWSRIILVVIGLVFYRECNLQMTANNQTIDNVISLLGVQHWCYFIFMVLGTLARQYYSRLQQWLDNKWLLAACISFYLLVNAFGDVLPVYARSVSLMLSLTGIAIVFSFFRKKQAVFSRETALGRTMQYVGRRTLDIYLLHYFFLPTNLNFITLFRDHPIPIIEALTSSVLAIIIIAVCLLFSEIIRLSPWLAHWLFGARKS